VISAILTRELSLVMPDFVEGIELFAEEGQGNRYVVIKTTTEGPTAESIDFLRTAQIQALVVGYRTMDGNLVSEKVSQALQRMTGRQAGLEDGRVYKIKAVTVKTFPTMINFDRSWTANFTVTYTVSRIIR